MSFRNQVIIILIFYFISFAFLRAFLYCINRYQLNNSAYKKRKKGENFKEWLFYSRYKEEIPKILFALYYTVLIIHPVCLIICLLLYIMKQPLNIGRTLGILIMGFDTAWILVIALLFWSPGPDFPIERWITKKRGQTKRKKK